MVLLEFLPLGDGMANVPQCGVHPRFPAHCSPLTLTPLGVVTPMRMRANTSGTVLTASGDASRSRMARDAFVMSIVFCSSSRLSFAPDFVAGS